MRGFSKQETPQPGQKEKGKREKAKNYRKTRKSQKRKFPHDSPVYKAPISKIDIFPQNLDFELNKEFTLAANKYESH